MLRRSPPPPPLFLVLAFALSTAVGCGLDSAGMLRDGGDSDTSTPLVDAADQDTTIPIDDGGGDRTNPIDAPADVPIAVADGGCVAATCEGKRCVAGQCDYYAACGDMHADDPNLASGAYVFYSSKKNATFHAYCDMGTSDGGWTLVGASAAAGGNGGGNFGWRKSTGSLANDSAPYSLDAASYGLSFTEALFGVRALVGKSFLTLGAVYKITLPANFMGNSLKTDDATNGAIAKVAGLCFNPTPPTMLTRSGQTDRGDAFFFRDLTGGDNGNFYGLQPNHIAVVYYADECTQSGGLGKIRGISPSLDLWQQGLLFAR
ncbi:hypothetical protein BH09MYX1_BH09MYX1_18260 [soil metagenome]